MSYRFLLPTAIFFLFISCSNDNSNNENSLFSKLEPSQTGIDFVNEVKNGEEMNIFKYRNFYNGGGVSIGYKQ